MGRRWRGGLRAPRPRRLTSAEEQAVDAGGAGAQRLCHFALCEPEHVVEQQAGSLAGWQPLERSDEREADVLSSKDLTLRVVR